ncbi:unnamed protein product [Brassica oleracea var. botrytis]|uniref:(rape) hypothetical protein n=1 Tax=Brassica napus TaxID=3708 RepID=A0A816ICF5_BRANA|nr:unnamed protein product [Brassica napus]
MVYARLRWFNVVAMVLLMFPCLVRAAFVKPYMVSGMWWKYFAGSDVGSSLCGFGLAISQIRHQKSIGSSFLPVATFHHQFLDDSLEFS